ncbi:MAG: hypothetical protein ACRDQA_30675 [Nocardioidaceae bacterium]
MTVTVEITDTCAVCGCRVRGVSVRTARVNKRSMRISGVGLGVCEPCPECGRDWSPGQTSAYRLTEDSAREARLERERKWPELRAEVSLP